MEIIKDDKIYFGGATSPIKVGVKLSDADIKVDSKNIETGDTPQGKLLAADGEGKTEWVDASGGTEVVANPTLEGGEQPLTGLQVDGVKYKTGSGRYLHHLVVGHVNETEQFEGWYISNSSIPYSTQERFTQDTSKQTMGCFCIKISSGSDYINFFNEANPIVQNRDYINVICRRYIKLEGSTPRLIDEQTKAMSLYHSNNIINDYVVEI